MKYLLLMFLFFQKIELSNFYLYNYIEKITKVKKIIIFSNDYFIYKH